MITTGSNAKHHHILEHLGFSMGYSSAPLSMSPFFSDIGLCFKEDPGIESLELHYNRRTTSVGSPFLPLPGVPVSRLQSPLQVEHVTDQGRARFAFYARNSWLAEFSNAPLQFTWPLAHSPIQPWVEIYRDTFLFYCQFPSPDPRDPDSDFPVVIGIRVLNGTQKGGASVNDPLQIEPEAGGTALVAFTVRCLDISKEAADASLADAQSGIDAAVERTASWISSALGNMELSGADPRHMKVLATAAYALVSNATQAPGILSGRISSFPSRGRYACHYLWDSCFQNLALEQMNPRLATDALLLLVETLRADGKMGHFLTSTWIRPHGSQPPLVGWAGLRLVKL